MDDLIGTNVGSWHIKKTTQSSHSEFQMDYLGLFICLDLDSLQIQRGIELFPEANNASWVLCCAGVVTPILLRWM